MAELLSKEGYLELAGRLEYRTQAFVDGTFHPARSGRPMWPPAIARMSTSQ
jgi:gamma-glutamyl-gamma-aminobutyraldehyde dehydrogenase